MENPIPRTCAECVRDGHAFGPVVARLFAPPFNTERDVCAMHLDAAVDDDHVTCNLAPKTISRMKTGFERSLQSVERVKNA